MSPAGMAHLWKYSNPLSSREGDQQRGIILVHFLVLLLVLALVLVVVLVLVLVLVHS